MAKVTVAESTLDSIGDAIRAKNGEDTKYKPSQMPSAIGRIETPSLESLSATVNKVYVPSQGKNGFSQVVVNVPNSYEASDEGKVVVNSALTAQTSTTKTANGTYDTTTNNEVVVNVANSYTASDEGKVVSNGALVAQGSQTIRQNGTYDTTLISALIANISGGGGSKNILGGTTAPTSADGTDGDIYIQYKDYSSGGGLPSGYTAVEYIDNNNQSAYINTGYIPTADSVFELDCNLHKNSLTYNLPFGARDGDGNKACTVNTRYGGSYTFKANWGNSENTVMSGSTAEGYYEKRIVMTHAKGHFTINGDDVTDVDYTYTGGDVTSTRPVYLFNFNSAGSVESSCYCYMKVYSFTIKENDNIVKEFIPATRDSDSAVGFYETQGETFYTNAGSGSLVAGDVAEGTPIDTVYLKVNGSWIILENGNWDDVNTEGSGGSTNILSGEDAPTSQIGDNGAIYLKHNPTSGSNNNLLENYQNIDLWTKNSAAFTRHEVTFDGTESTLVHTGGNGYERIYVPVTVEQNTDYTFEMLYYPSTNVSSGYSENLNMSVYSTNQSGSGGSTSGRLGKTDLSRTATSDFAQYELTINSGSNTTLYVVIDLNIYDGNTNTLHFKNLFFGQGLNAGVITNAYLKVSGTWGNLIGSNIDDVNTGD